MRRMPWQMETENGVIIISPTIPLTITDRKPIVFAASNIPGINFTPLTPAMNGNANVAFTLPIIDRKDPLGNQAKMAQFEALRNKKRDIKSLFTRGARFDGNPQVLYYWGTHRPPLWWWVRKCDFTHTATLRTPAGLSQYSMVDVELELDEENKLFRAWEMEQSVAELQASGQNIAGIGSTDGSRPY